MSANIQKTKIDREIIVNGEKALTDENKIYDGLGFISANNSSRLLMDYKAEHEDAYWEILKYMFGDDGIHMSLIKMEMGADVDSSSGTEPALKRYADEKADATRGAGPMIVADALTINPNIDVDMLYWGIPAWVKNAEDTNKAMYQWYKESIEALYDQYGIKMTYLTVGQNERQINPELIKYVSKALKEETDCRYDYSSIKIVAGEGVCDWKIADAMLEDNELMEAVDVITSHYTSFTSDNARKLQNEYGKKVWFSEGSSPMKSAELTSKKVEDGNGLSGINGCLDIASRITQAITDGMTMYEFQPAVSSYYNGATYFPKQLITANEPWSGAYSFDVGFYMGLQFASVLKDNMFIIKDACYGDGKAGGDGHAIVDSKFNYVTMTDSEKKDFSTVIVNNTAEPITYGISVSNIANAANGLNMYVTEENDGDNYFESFFVNKGKVSAVSTDDNSYYEIVAPAFSIVSVTTLDIAECEYKDRSEDKKLLELPYSDDFTYSGYDKNHLESRGNAPRYTTDEGGAFEVTSVDGENVLMQQIAADNIPADWGSTAKPTTNFGDDTWKDYSVSIDAHFTKSEIEYSTVNYVGVGIRYNFADEGMSGYQLRLGADGHVGLFKGSTSLVDKEMAVDTSSWYNLKIEAVDNIITGFVNGEKVLEFADESLVVSGRAALYSNYQNNYFKNLLIESAKDDYSIARIDDMDDAIEYSKGSSLISDEEGLWYFETMSSFSNYNRTQSVGTPGCELSFEFDGTGFALIGKCREATLSIQIDDSVSDDVTAFPTGARQSFYYANGLSNGAHKITVKVTSGKINLDAIEIY